MQKTQEISLKNIQKDINRIIESVVRSQQAVFISDQGKLLVKIIPVVHPEPTSWLGCMKGKGKIVGDIISPAEEVDVWGVLAE